MERNRSGSINITLDLVSQIGKNLLMRSPVIRRWRLNRPRTGTIYSNTEEFLKNYAFCSLELLREHVGDLNGKTICEIGPGDYLTSGLSILAAGASRYSVIDRFPGDYVGDAARIWYREIEKHWPRFYPELPWPGNLPSEHFPECAAERLELIGESLETAQTSKKYDIVCSFQVGEHLSDIDAFAEMHNRVLTEGGIGLHRVDFGPHDVWFSYRDPGTFLRFSDRVWNLTGSNRGVPNRKRHHEFLEAFDRASLDVDILYIDYFDKDAMVPEDWNKKFRAMPEESVLTGTAIYRLRKR